MRVLHVVRDDDGAHVGGDRVMLHAQVRALQELGIDAVAGPIRAVAGPIRADFGPPDIVHLYNLLLPGALVRDERRARRLWPQARLTVSPVFFPWPMRAMLRAGDPAAWWRAGKTGAKVRAAWPAVRRLLGAADAVTPGSAGELARLARFYALAPGPGWSPVPCGLWPTEWPSRGHLEAADRSAQLAVLGLDPDLKTLVACVGRVEPRKNQMALVEAVLRRPQDGLVLVGPFDGTRYGARVAGRIRRELAGRGVCTGPLAQPEVAAILRRVDVHVLPSFWESPGLASLEAAASGAEVVITSGGATLEYFGRSAHLAGSPRWPALGAAIDDALSNPHQPGLGLRVQRFDWSRSAEMLAAVYREMLAQPPAERDRARPRWRARRRRW